MKNSYYFSHDYSSRNDQKILTLRGEYGLEGYAIFFMILESMAEDTEGFIYRVAMGGLSISYGIPKDRLIEIIDFCIKIGLFYENELGIYSKRMLEQKNMRKLYAEKGKEGAIARRGNRGAISNPNAKERKGKEKKEKERKKDNTIVLEQSSFGNPDINLVIEELKKLSNELGVAYDKKEDRKFGKHICTAKEFGEFCEKLGQDRITFAKNIMIASIKINFWKGPCAGPMTIYQNYSEVYNLTKSLSKKDKEKKGGVGVLSSIYD